jgi:hypothetical protein
LDICPIEDPLYPGGVVPILLNPRSACRALSDVTTDLVNPFRGKISNDQAGQVLFGRAMGHDFSL